MAQAAFMAEEGAYTKAGETEVIPSSSATKDATGTTGKEATDTNSPKDRDIESATPASQVPEPESMTAADYAAMAIHKNWRQGNPIQFKIMVGISVLCFLGNLLIWTQSDFMKSPHEAPPFFAVLCCNFMFAASCTSSIYRGTLRSFATLILHNALDICLCTTAHFFKVTNAETLTSSQVSSTKATTAQLHTIRCGCVIVMMSGFAGVIAIYADHKRFSKATVGRGVGNGNGIVAIIVSFFLCMGSFLLWSIKEVCTNGVNASINITGPFCTFIVLLLSALTNDFEGRDLAFVYLMSGWVNYKPIFTKVGTNHQKDANSVYKAGVSFLYIGCILFTFATIGIAIKRRGPRAIPMKANIPLIVGLVVNIVVAITGAAMVWAKTHGNDSAASDNYMAAVALFVCILQLPGVLANIDSITLLNLVLSPLVIDWSYPAIFGSTTGTDRAGMILLTGAVMSCIFLPKIYQAVSNGGFVAGKSMVNDRSRPYFVIAIVLAIAAWLALTETDMSSAKNTTGKLQLTGITGYIGVLLGLSYACHDQDGIKMSMYLTGAGFLEAWPWSLGYNNIEGTSTIITFFALVFFMFRYLTELGDGPFLSLTIPGDEVVADDGTIYQGEEYKSGVGGGGSSISGSDGGKASGGAKPRGSSSEEELGAPLIGDVTDEPPVPEEDEPIPVKSKAKKN